MAENRRQFERIPILLEVVLELTSGKRDCRISDLSMGGCFVDTIANVSKGEKIGLQLRLSTGQWLGLSGEVMYVYPTIGFGLRFTGLTNEERIQLQQVILEHGGNPAPQLDATVETETKKPAEEAARQDPNSKETESKSADEFQQFMQDLFGDNKL